MNKKTVRYNDERSDDFAATGGRIKTRRVDGSFRYVHNNIFWKLGAAFLYRIIATPIAWSYCKIGFGIRIENKRAIRGIKTGYFLYVNHTQNVADAFIPSLVTFPKKCRIIVGPDAVSVPAVRFLVPMLGGIPLACDAEGKKHFHAAVDHFASVGDAICIYPEAHIWPYYNKIRDYPDGSFVYPLRNSLPAVPCTVTYRCRKLFKRLPPCITVKVGDPVYPDGTERKQLRDAVWSRMTADAAGSYEYVRYERNCE